MMKETWDKEARIIGRYLVQDEISDVLADRYVDAMQKLQLKEDETTALLAKVVRQPWRLPYYDAALAFRKKMPQLRRKVFTMLAILETSTDYTHKFLNRKRSIFYLFKMIFVGLKAVWRFLVGSLLLLF